MSSLRQSVARRDGYKQAAQARRLNQQRTLAPHVLAATVVAEVAAPVVEMAAEHTFWVGNIVVARKETFYLVTSRFAGRCYLVANVHGEWCCSASEEAVASLMIERVQAHLAALELYQQEQQGVA